MTRCSHELTLPLVKSLDTPSVTLINASASWHTCANASHKALAPLTVVGEVDLKWLSKGSSHLAAKMDEGSNEKAGVIRANAMETGQSFMALCRMSNKQRTQQHNLGRSKHHLVEYR